MIADLKPYSEYNDSGLPWLGQVPGHWEVRRLRASITDCVNGVWGSDPNGEDDLICVRVADFDRVALRVSLRRKTVRAIPFSARSRRLLQRGDLLLEKSGGGDLQPVGAVVAYDCSELAVCSNFVARMKIATGYHSFFLSYLHSTLYALRINVRSIKQTTGIQNLDGKAYLSELVAFPPPEEQAAIVRFLDWANGRLERTIRAKRKVIALLNEQKQAIIHRAVTRGLDPNVPLKPSGIPWLGDIPAHWEVRRLGRLAKVFNGTTPSRAQSSYWSNGTIPWLASGKVNDHIISTPSELITARALTECSLMIVPSGALLMGLIGQGRTRGMCALLGIDACISQNLAAIVPEPTLSSHFLYHVLVACYDDVRELGRGGNQAALNCEIVGRLPIPVPPPEEQVAIDQALTAEVSHLLPLERTIQREIELLREYRTRLVADVVTGKLDVRAAAEQLPEEAPPEPAEVEEVEYSEEGDAEPEELEI